MSESIFINLSPKINYACHQNDIAILKELKVINTKNIIWEDVKISMESSLNFIRPKTWQIKNMNPGEEISIKDRRIDLDGDFLRNLEEAISGTVKFIVEADRVVIEEIELPIQVLAYNEWGGLEYIPELLAAFVMPNSSGIDSILGETGRMLAKNGKDSALNGYSDNNATKVWDMVSALYTVLANKNFTYCLPPTSFEHNGQKIRLTKDILNNRVVTCLDATILFASALEQMGLYPVIVVIKGHAFVGVWLKPTSLGDMIVDSAEQIRKRIVLNELLVFEAVAISSSPIPKFSIAKSLAEEKIAYGNDDNFEYMLDVHMARAHKIKPISLASNNNDDNQSNVTEEQLQLDFEVAPNNLPDFSDETKYNDTDISETTRLNIWQKKLLNLSPSNPLLNCKITQSNLAILCPNPAKLEDFLADGVKMSLVPAEKVLNTRIDPDLRALRTGEVLWQEQANEALKAKQLLVNTPESKLGAQLVALYRKTKSILEEGGSNTLYLAIGFLNWKKKDKSDKVYHAPLILCPVKLERVSIQSGVKLSAHEDESRFNTTLLQMLKQDFEISIPSLEGELPTDDSGLDVPEIWNRVRHAVKEVDGFEVVEEVVLGHFSFNKYLMWKDLIDRTDAMMEHPLVASLIDKTKKMPEDGDFVEPKDLDELYKPQDFFVPLPMDSSQLAVLAAADKGKSFVIEGPPGTGKSQTISNLIAHLMTKGKTVLFVSEKMAALEVVYRRLEQIGLGRFCLQLHSNKANKRDVLNQLKLSWDNANTNIENNWLGKSGELLRIRNVLNETVKALHTPGTNGLTPYYAMGVCIRNSNLADLIQFNWNSSSIHTTEDYSLLKDLVHKIKIQAESCRSLFGSKAFSSIINNNWEPVWQQAIVSESKTLSECCSKLDKISQDFKKAIDINIEINDINIISSLYELAQILKDSSLYTADYAFNKNGMEKIESLENAITHLTAYINAKEQLHCICPPDIWKNIDGQDLFERWNLALQKWFLPAFIDKFSIKQELKKAGAKGNIIMPNDAITIGTLREHGNILQELDKLLNDVRVWKIENSNVKDLEDSANLAKKLRQISAKLATNPTTLNMLREKLDKLLIDSRELLVSDGFIGQQISLLEKAYKDFNDSYEKLKNLCNASNCEFANERFNELNTLQAFIEYSNELSSNEGKLKDWCYWQKLKQNAIQNNLKPLIDAIESYKINYSDIELAFEAAYCSWWTKAIISENQILREFSSLQHMDRIKQFIRLDDEFQQLTIKYIQAKLSENIPGKDSKNLSSAWKLIQREMQKQRQIKPVRQILAEAGEAVKTLSPCLMMSPLSVAQYLPVSKDSFDVVVFDEASQITVWDAIGTLSRGQQIIVAGDPKQMPPSNFFGRNIEYNEEELGLDEDLESILDELIGSSMPTLRLNWHYRSHCESLIAFSNDRYYDGSLVTFPAASTNQKSVSLRYVEDGCYERGARINQNEAKAVVKECVTRLQDPNPEIRNKSIGIVTFNSDQQKLIEDLLDKERESHPEIEFAFNPDNPDAVFVKNLETVQGDERDLILFSVTYGPDNTGKVSMNFGPLNRNGGERRLNVAFTRAKYEMIIFSTLKADQIDLNRTNARGVEDLKAFLQYAKQGKSALGSYVTKSLGGVESPFEAEVAEQLRNKGWTVHTQIGTSSYRIDLAIVHPDKPGAYLAGIECDGATYHSSATARDRDKLRQSVLEGLGWTILRVWSTDWWTNKKGSIEDLNNKLKQLYEKSKQKELCTN